MRGVFLLLILFNIGLAAQKPADFFKEVDNNYGTLENGATLLSVFKFTNSTNKNIYVLSATGSRFITVEFSRRAVAPGATDSIVLRYEPKAKGQFRETVSVVLSALDRPFNLEISGNIKNYNQDFLTQCVRYGTVGTAGVFRFEHKGTVLDDATGKPIQGASVQIVDRGGMRGDERTNRQGTYTKEIPPGQYEFIVTAPGYIGRYDEFYINPQKPDAVFRLPKLKPEEMVALTAPVDEIPNPETTIPATPATPPTEPTPPAAIPVEKPGELSYANYKANNVVFLIDVSGSMKDSMKLPLLKQSMQKLVATLRPIDRLTIVTYADGVTIAMPSTPVTDKDKINGIIDGLRANGKTEGGKGMKKAYRLAEANFIEGGNNQIFMATDGSFSSLGEEEGDLTSLIGHGTKKGISLSILGFGKSKVALKTMEKFAKQGNGSYLLVNDNADADVLVNEVKEKSKK